MRPRAASDLTALAVFTALTSITPGCGNPGPDDNTGTAAEGRALTARTGATDAPARPSAPASAPGELRLRDSAASAVFPAASPTNVALSVAGPAGEAVTEYRWLIEEDATYNVVPGVMDPHTLSVSFHRSYMPVVAHGDQSTPPSNVMLDPSKFYFISVLPTSGYTLSGVRFSGANPVARVRCTATPLATAQVSVFVFEDNAPINNAPSLPQERGLPGFHAVLFEAGGRYGVAGGMVSQDVFGNPIGTTYLPDGTPDAMGMGFLHTDATGHAYFKNLAQAKYTVKITPPRGEGWIQTNTIEGTAGIDAWVKPNEPRYFQEFGPPSAHTEFGFVREFTDATVLRGGATISGQIVNNRMSRPPATVFYPGVPFEHTTAYIGLNDAVTGGRGVFVKKAGDDGSFAIPNVPPGTYQLVIWDTALDIIFAFHTVIVPAGGANVELGVVPVFQWFTQFRAYVFHDVNGNGFREPTEPGLPEVPVNIRWRDGTIYAMSATDTEGFVPFEEVFPFFAWQVAEVGTERFKLTGATIVADEGGPVDPADPWSFGGLVTPQLQPENGNLPYRTQPGPAKTQAFQGFIGSTNAVLWGKKEYDHLTHENGGISGAVYYDIMRGASDARNTGQEVNEPGIPGVTINLYDANTMALVATTKTVAWDENLPAGCVAPPFTFHGVPTDCYDGLRVFNQVRPGIYDGMYSFANIPSGLYVVEAVSPLDAQGRPLYQITREEDQNLDFGEEYVPGTLMPPPECVGALHRVPAETTLFPGITPLHAGKDRPLCDRKKVALHDGQNGAADFFMFTEVPIAGHIIGFILDDASNEFDPNAPTFGEKYAPPWLPVSIRDWDGAEIARTYSDEFGVYNALVPSTFTMNVPMPSGIAPKMLTACMNDPGPIPDAAHPGQFITDPWFNPQYSQFCYTMQYMPGSTTYLDTPVVPVAAFAGSTIFPLDCEPDDGTPRILSVSGPQGGPYVSATNQSITITAMGPTPVLNPLYDGSNGTQAKLVTRDYGFGATRGTVSINGTPAQVTAWSAGAITATVRSGTGTGQLVVTRGDNRKSTIDSVTVTVRRTDDTYSVIHVQPGGSIQAAIDGAAPADLILVPPGSYQELVVMWKPVRLQGWGQGSTHIVAAKTPAEKLVGWRAKVMGLIDSGAVSLIPNQAAGAPDPAQPIEPLTLFSEEGPGIIVLAKNANVAGGGFGQDARGLPNARIDGFTVSGGDNAGGIMVNGFAHYLQVSNNRIQNNAGTFGGGMRFGHPLVLNTAGNDYQSAFNDRVKVIYNNINRNGGLEGAGGGISIYTGTDYYLVDHNFICGNYTQGHGGGIGHLGTSANGVISYNKIVFNESFFQAQTVNGGGIFIGGETPLAVGGVSPGSGRVTINANLIQGNGATAGDGGGIRVERASGFDVVRQPNRPDQWYRVDIENNMIIDNVAALAGGGISLQDSAIVNIMHNTVVHNDSTGTAGAAFTPGSPNQSNPQPAGIVSRAHSPELAAAFGSNRSVTPYKVFSNPQLVNDVVWQNRSFHFQVNTASVPPTYLLIPNVAAGQPAVYADLAVLGTATAQRLTPRYCLLTSRTGYDSTNLQGDPSLVANYVNGSTSQIAFPETVTGIQPPPAFDEGGNFIKVKFGPISLVNPATGLNFGNAHIQSSSMGRARGMPLNFLSGYPDLRRDFDGDLRPLSNQAPYSRPDIGADQYR